MNTVLDNKCDYCGLEYQSSFRTTGEFFDPPLTSDGKNYAQERFREIVKERYLISKNCNTSYSDLADVTPLERNYLLELIIDELQKKKKMIEEQRAKQKH